MQTAVAFGLTAGFGQEHRVAAYVEERREIFSASRIPVWHLTAAAAVYREDLKRAPLFSAQKVCSAYQ
jgi:hypothetical protein